MLNLRPSQTRLNLKIFIYKMQRDGDWDFTVCSTSTRMGFWSGKQHKSPLAPWEINIYLLSRAGERILIRSSWATRQKFLQTSILLHDVRPSPRALGDVWKWRLLDSWMCMNIADVEMLFSFSWSVFRVEGLRWPAGCCTWLRWMLQNEQRMNLRITHTGSNIRHGDIGDHAGIYY